MLIEHWTGHAWSIVPAPSPTADGGSSLFSVSTVSANDVWAVGIIGVPPAGQALIEHWNGTHWTRVTLPFQETMLSSVDAVSARSVWATSPGHVLHWNGTTWSRRTQPGSGFLGDVGGPAGQVWTAGVASDRSSPFAAPVSATVPALRSR